MSLRVPQDASLNARKGTRWCSYMNLNLSCLRISFICTEKLNTHTHTQIYIHIYIYIHVCTEKLYIYNTHTHTDIHIYIYIHVCICAMILGGTYVKTQLHCFKAFNTIWSLLLLLQIVIILLWQCSIWCTRLLEQTFSKIFCVIDWRFDIYVACAQLLWWCLKLFSWFPFCGMVRVLCVWMLDVCVSMKLVHIIVIHCMTGSADNNQAECLRSPSIPFC